MGGKRIPTEVKKEVLKLFEQGYGKGATATVLGLSLDTVKGWYILFRSGNQTWVDSSYTKTDAQKLEMAVEEYLHSPNGLNRIAVKYGLRGSTLFRGYKNFVNFGLVNLPKGRNAMKRLQEQKRALAEKLQTASKKEYLTSKKEYKEMRDLILVNIALLEVLEESHPDELKKKNSGSKKSSWKTS